MDGILRRLVLGATAEFLFVSLAPAAFSATNGQLTGIVMDSQGGRIPYAIVSAKNVASGVEFKTVATVAGVYWIASVPPGIYNVSATKQGFKTTILKDINAEPDSIAKADAVLQVGLNEVMIITASKYEEEVVNAPASVSVVGEPVIEASQSHSVVELLRAVPGMNVLRTSATSFSVSGRAAAALYTDAQLALIDGRTIYRDYLGAVDWNLVSINLDEIKQVEIVRGPASAIWGAYAMNGVINIITTPPREMRGTSLTLGIGTFDRSGGAAKGDTGALYSAAATHAQAFNDRWAFKIAGGVYTQDAFARPEGPLPNNYHTPYPAYPSKGTTQPKADLRIDYDFPDGNRHLVFGGGYVSSSGIAHTGAGPLDCRLCVGSYGKIDYIQNSLKITAFVNAENTDSPSLLFKGPNGQPVDWRGNAQTYDLSFSNYHTIPDKHLISYGGNFRHNEFDQSSMPEARSRNDGGVYFQDEFLLSRHFRWIFGARFDKFENLKGIMFSPRTTFIVKPVPSQTFRFSYNRAYVAPPTYGNYARLVFMTPLDLGILDPQLAGNYFNFPGSLVGNRQLRERSLNAYEVGYIAAIARSRASLSAAFYINDGKGQFYYPVTKFYTSQNPPPGWPLPLHIIDLMNAAGVGLSEVMSFGNLGKVRNKGIELSAEVQISRFVSGSANYSWQARPNSKDYDVSVFNLPPTHRFNAGIRYDYKRYFGDLSVSYVGSAYWNDMISLAYSGSTKSYRTVNAGAGIRWGESRQYSAAIKASNLANTRIQNHVFGDILKRQISAEFKMRL